MHKNWKSILKVGNNMHILGSFVFSISDLNLDFDELENRISIKPTKTIKKGQMVGKSENIRAPYDIWSYEVRIQGTEDDIFAYLSLLIDDLLPYSKYINEARRQYEEVVINCYLRSDLAQIGFNMNNNIISKLESLGLDVDFHILSFGRVNRN